MHKDILFFLLLIFRFYAVNSEVAKAVIDFFELDNNEFGILKIAPIYQYYTNDESIAVDKRINNGLVFYSNCSAEYYSGNEFLFPAPINSIVFLPQHSSYKVKFHNSNASLSNGIISNYLINFEIFGTRLYNEQPPIVSKNLSPNILLMLNDIFSLDSAKSRIKIASSFYNVLNIIFDQNSKTDLLIQPAIDFLSCNPKFSQISVNYLADICNMHITTFRRHFENCFGVSPNEYIANEFVKRANYHLITEQISVKETADILGFESISYFRRFYKKHTDISPSKIGRNNLTV